MFVNCSLFLVGSVPVGFAGWQRVTGNALSFTCTEKPYHWIVLGKYTCFALSQYSRYILLCTIKWLNLRSDAMDFYNSTRKTLNVTWFCCGFMGVYWIIYDFLGNFFGEFWELFQRKGKFPFGGRFN